MALIITATDFSEVAENAVNYACQLATSCHAHVVVLHSFMLPVMFNDLPMQGSIVVDEQKDAEAQMTKLIQRLSQDFSGLKVEGKVIYGDTLDILEDYKENALAPMMVVVGNSSLHETNSWSESVLINAFKSLHYPVLAIPPGAKFKPVKKICFAADSIHGGYDLAVGQLKNIAIELRAEIHVLHIITTGKHQENTNPETDLKGQLAEFNPHYHLVYDAGNTDNAILDFGAANEIDWLIMMPRKHSFFNALFHKSHTRSLVHQSHLPILALHESKIQK